MFVKLEPIEDSHAPTFKILTLNRPKIMRKIKIPESRVS